MQAGDMGSGKTWMLIVEAAILYARGEIDGVLVIAPKGVDLAWAKLQLPEHMPHGVRWRVQSWRPSTAKRFRQQLETILAPSDSGREMRWLTMNWDALATRRGREFAEQFLRSLGGESLVIADESQRMKNPKAQRTKALLEMRTIMKYRRAASGTPSLGTPFDLFSQYSWLDDRILGTTSFYAFKAEYAKLLKPGNPLYESILDKMSVARKGAHMGYARVKAKHEYPNASAEQIADIADQIATNIAREKSKRRMPQIVQQDAQGHPSYRNLDKLARIIEPYTYRVLKKDVMNLPEKVYVTSYYTLTPRQRKAYEEVRENHRLLLDDGTIEPLTALTAISKRAQITSGFYIETAEGITHAIPGENPKLELLRDRLENMEPEDKAIVWTNLKAEVDLVAGLCREIGLPHVEYHGEIGDEQRHENVSALQHGSARVIVANTRAGGTGLTLTAANRVFYFSNRASLGDRKQSEDRAHRIGQDREVIYEDFVAEDTIEEVFIPALQRKEDVAAAIMGDVRSGGL